MNECRAISDKYILSPEILSESLEFLYSPILLKGKVHLFYSPPGVGKSSLIYKVIQNLLRSQRVNRVLCIFSDLDVTNAEFQELVSEFHNPDDVSKSRFIPVFPQKGYFEDLVKSIQDGSLKEQGIDLILIDSLEQFFVLSGKSFFKGVGVFMGILRWLGIFQGVTTVLIHHTNKEGDFAGHSSTFRQADVFYRIRRAGRFKWFGDALKHRGAKLLNGQIDFYAELVRDRVEITNEIMDDRWGYAVYLIKQVLAESGSLPQYEIVNKVRELAQKEKGEVGKHKVREALAKFDGVYWKSEKGQRNSLWYELIVQVKVEEKDQDRDKILSEIEEMIKKKILFADDLPPLLYNGKEYKVFTDIAKDVPTSVLKEYLQRIKEEFAGVEEVAEDF
jgi:DNA polymerase III delta prime subunit